MIYVEKNFKQIKTLKTYNYITDYWIAKGFLILNSDWSYNFMIEKFEWIQDNFVMPETFVGQKIHIEYTHFNGDIYICKNLEMID